MANDRVPSEQKGTKKLSKKEMKTTKGGAVCGPVAIGHGTNGQLVFLYPVKPS